MTSDPNAASDPPSVPDANLLWRAPAETPNTDSLAHSDRKSGVPPVMEDSASSLSAHETTGWKPVFHDRQDAYPPAKLTGSDRPSFFDELSVGNE